MQSNPLRPRGLPGRAVVVSFRHTYPPNRFLRSNPEEVFVLRDARPHPSLRRLGRVRATAALLLLALAVPPAGAQAPPSRAPQAGSQRPPDSTSRPAPSPQRRPHGTRVTVDPSRVVVDDGDTAIIQW